MGGTRQTWQNTGLTFGLGLIVGCAVCALLADLEVSSRLRALPFANFSDVEASLLLEGPTNTATDVVTTGAAPVAEALRQRSKSKAPGSSRRRRDAQSRTAASATLNAAAEAALVAPTQDPTSSTGADAADIPTETPEQPLVEAQPPPPSLPPPPTDEADEDISPAVAEPEPSATKGPSRLYKPVVYVKGQECSSQGANFGFVPTAEKCDAIAAETPYCGGHFMFSARHPEWQCRCCAPDGMDSGPSSSDWDVYTVQMPRGAPKKLKKGSGLLPNRECAKQAVTLGNIPTPKDCDEITALTPECGLFFMFSPSHPEWNCRCCEATSSGEEPGGPFSMDWNVHKVKTKRPDVLPGTPTLPPAVRPFRGLPVVEGPRMPWIIKEDELVVDTRRPAGHGGMLIVQAVLADSQSTWSKNQGMRPRWLRAILATNREHARRHGHALVLRAQPSQPQLTAWQWRQCRMKDAFKCVQQNERENFNWEKHKMMAEYMLSSQNFTHILMLDADAALIRHEHNTLQRIAKTMEEKGKEVFLTNEDWLDKNGASTINGGLMFVKNTVFTQNVFQDTFDAHIKGSAMLRNWRIGIDKMECSSNEQICLNDLWQGSGKSVFAPHAMMASGLIYNRGAERGGDRHMNDPKVEVMHWMGGSKSTAGQSLCDGTTDFTGEGPRGYGCQK